MFQLSVIPTGQSLCKIGLYKNALGIGSSSKSEMLQLDLTIELCASGSLRVNPPSTLEECVFDVVNFVRPVFARRCGVQAHLEKISIELPVSHRDYVAELRAAPRDAASCRFSFAPVSEADVLDAFSRMTSNAVGRDDIPTLSQGYFTIHTAYYS
ncbi:hypothetical protein J6590_083504 [Homalodisca vitripennis]|nr:hypothetical protein J6590_083504 [Homalodisca vitripennis]